jgi:hypothetical protein
MRGWSVYFSGGVRSMLVVHVRYLLEQRRERLPALCGGLVHIGGVSSELYILRGGSERIGWSERMHGVRSGGILGGRRRELHKLLGGIICVEQRPVRLFELRRG